jgi:hypothetical protein
MTYVDLTPVRANIAKTPEQSDYPSIQSILTIYNLALAPALKALTHQAIALTQII